MRKEKKIMALNKIMIQGRLTRDPELRYTPGGKAVTGFVLAVDRDVKNKETGKRESDFIEVVVWGDTAEFVSKYFSRGSQAVVEGRLQVRDWIDKEGGKRRTAEVVANNVYFCGSKGENGSGAPRMAGNDNGGNDFHEIPDDESDLPF